MRETRSSVSNAKAWMASPIFLIREKRLTLQNTLPCLSARVKYTEWIPRPPRWLIVKRLLQVDSRIKNRRAYFDIRECVVKHFHGILAVHKNMISQLEAPLFPQPKDPAKRSNPSGAGIEFLGKVAVKDNLFAFQAQKRNKEWEPIYEYYIHPRMEE